ncbi:hypothetical protein J1C67_05765 [Clostridium gasigenes]|uniref:hypothetical protein n=1 Tax=Clostridium gasigenes TaxID=94869 RepID=UPI00143855F5|nr:hypothetical protein [Clostridium gasigenes]NKF07955.1 hypothetical protein [Clostridium gasigenes]QSW20668.1 hypothetical protein J1C67_05765 [Clostridium gasigenes]
MKDINFDKILIFLIFLMMAYLNYIGYIAITDYGIFGLTFGGLLVCISTCFQGKKSYGYKIKIKTTYIIKQIFYATGWGFIVISAYLKNNIFLDSLLEALDANTLMLLSLAITFLSLIVAEKARLNQKKRIDKIEKMVEKSDERRSEMKDTLTKLIKKTDNDGSN